MDGLLHYLVNQALFRLLAKKSILKVFGVVLTPAVPTFVFGIYELVITTEGSLYST